MLGMYTISKLHLAVNIANDSSWGYLHLVQLFIDFLVILVVFAKLGDQRPISQSEQLRVLQQKTTQLSYYIIFAAQNLMNHTGASTNVTH